MNSVEDTNTMQLLWEDSETLSDMNKGSETESQANVEDDLLGLCSGNFGETQASKQNDDVNSSMNGLFSQPATQSVEDAELMGLCSGTFATQLPVQVEKFFLGFLVGVFLMLLSRTQNSENITSQEIPVTDQSVTVARGKLFLDSDDEVENPEELNEKKKKKKKKRKQLQYSGTRLH
jgi:hypothetical protein